MDMITVNFVTVNLAYITVKFAFAENYFMGGPQALTAHRPPKWEVWEGDDPSRTEGPCIPRKIYNAESPDMHFKHKNVYS